MEIESDSGALLHSGKLLAYAWFGSIVARGVTLATIYDFPVLGL